MSHTFTNRLIEETSPYLLQHAHNPVNWFPWCEEALKTARQQNKPILLSIGYSSCHWCHVMERESFENEVIADIMNRHFVNIKVDREERPDLDSIYMNYVQMATGQGGWPLTVFLTPDLIPFFGGTYFPPVSALGRMGFKTVLENIHHFFQTQRDQIQGKQRDILAGLKNTARVNFGEQELDEDLLEQAFINSMRQFDSRNGGFGAAPKFPSTMTLAFLLRWHQRTHNQAALDAVTLTLDSMARGGIYDHLGGGFHRYSVDDRWLVPHFEKMLYDNALLTRLYLEAYQVTGEVFYRLVAEETLAYVQRDMTSIDGGFYSAEDADSEGEEGKFYVWTVEETREILGLQDSELFNDYYDVTTAGNWEGKNILHPQGDLTAYAKERDLPPEELKGFLDLCRSRLFQSRKERVRPLLDDKVLASWNGLMLTAFAEAAGVLDNSDFLRMAERNAHFLTSRMLVRNRLQRTWKNNDARLLAYLDDYAHIIEGLITLYEVGGDPVWIDQALSLMETQLALFYDEERGDFFLTSEEHEALPVRQKEFFDNALPSGNSVSSLNLLKLAVLTGQNRYGSIARRMLERMAGGMSQHPLAFSNWLRALDFQLGPVKEIVLIGPPGGRDTLMEGVWKRFLPRKVVVQADAPNPELADKIPLLANRGTLNGKSTAYVCENFSCREPTSDISVLSRLLDGQE